MPDRAIGPLGLFFLGSDKEPKGAGAQGRQEMQLSRFFSLSHSVNCCCRLSESFSVLKTTANNKQTVLHTFESVMKESEDDESEWLMKKFKATSQEFLNSSKF